MSMHNLQYPLTELCELALKYGSDKCPRIGHCYTPYYFEVFKNRRKSVKKLLEMGVGLAKYKNPYYVVGAGLRMWRDFFPNAQIFGADIAGESLFTEKRIDTYYCDERNKKDIKDLILKTGKDIDIVIDDASHHIHDQIFLLNTLMPLLDKKAVYIIEDCYRPHRISKMITKYDCHIPELLPNDSPERGSLVVFRHKNEDF